MRALVTGAAGFLGSHLCDELVRQGHEVDGLDDLSTGRARNLAQLHGSFRPFRLVTGSVLDEVMVERLARHADVVYHLAAAVGTFTIRDHGRHSLHVNLEGTRNVTEAARRVGAALLFTSSSEVYGTTPGVLSEGSPRIMGSPLRPRWSYAEAKAADESLVAAYARDGLRAVIVRPFNIAGPRQRADFGMVIPRFVQQALAGTDLTVHGHGTQQRTFCHVADAVPSLAALPQLPAAYGQAVNLGSAHQVSISALAQRVIELTGSSSKVSYLPLADVMGRDWDDTPRGVPDCTVLHGLTGFRAARDLDTVIGDVIEFERG